MISHNLSCFQLAFHALIGTELDSVAQGLMAFYVFLLFALFSVLILRLGFTQPCRKIV